MTALKKAEEIVKLTVFVKKNIPVSDESARMKQYCI